MKNWLDGMLYTVKDVRSVVVNINLPINKEKRADYVSKLFDARSSGRTIVWVDETNFNLYCKRREGRSKVGTRASVLLPASKGANLHCIGAMTSTTMVKFSTHRGAFKNAECNNWITELIQDCASQGIVNPTIIVDNAPAHARLEAAFENTSAEPLWLPPYCYLLLPYSYGTCMERD